MRTRRLTLLLGTALVAVITLLVEQRPVAGQEASDEPKLAGTWNVTARFPECTPTCTCPGGVPNIPIPALHTYQQNGSVLEVPGGTALRGPGVGSWNHLREQDFGAHFKFFIFNPDGSRRGSEEVTSQINLTDRNSFEAA
jgi:hypothetical protein